MNQRILIVLGLLVQVTVSGWSQDLLALTVLSENKTVDGWGHNVEEYKVFVAPDGMISRVDYQKRQGQSQKTTIQVRRAGTVLEWSDNRSGGLLTFRLSREKSRWVGSRTFPNHDKTTGYETRSMIAQWDTVGPRIWTDERISGRLLGGHYIEETLVPLAEIDPMSDRTLLELNKNLLIERVGEFVNSKITFTKSGGVIKASRLEQPDDGGFVETGRATITAKALMTSDPATNAANWKILWTIMPDYYSRPFLLDWKF